MATFAELRRFGLSLPGVREHLHMGQPSLRAHGKMFVLSWPPEKTTIMKLERHHQDMLFEVRPEIFTPCKVGTGRWSYVKISALDSAELRALVVEAWAQVVPKKISRAFFAAPSRAS
jgi:hypothetical protein